MRTSCNFVTIKLLINVLLLNIKREYLSTEYKMINSSQKAGLLPDVFFPPDQKIKSILCIL